MKKFVLKFLSSLFILSLVSCASNTSEWFGIEGNHHVVTQERNIQEPFTKIKVSSGIEVFFTESAQTSLRVIADENIQENLITEVKDQTLHIYNKKMVRNVEKKEVYLSAPSITDVLVTSGAYFKSKNILKEQKLYAKATSGAGIEIEIDNSFLGATANSGASLEVAGKTEKSDLRATSGSSIRAKNLQTENLSAHANSGASIKIHVNKKIEAKATSGGSIKYYGKPNHKDITRNSGGSVRSLGE
ncbi:MAG: DUF2807 domain-containing protein [Flavobacteriales bacterium]|jgi:hypothetical protein|nr:DUF2807 domain-containing protein [Flavobacteriales bacterium]